MYCGRCERNRAFRTYPMEWGISNIIWECKACGNLQVSFIASISRDFNKNLVQSELSSVEVKSLCSAYLMHKTTDRGYLCRLGRLEECE